MFLAVFIEAQAQQDFENNIRFVERGCNAFANEVFTLLDSTGHHSVVVRARSRLGDASAADFLRDVFVAGGKKHGGQIFVGQQSVRSDSMRSRWRERPDTLDLTIEQWELLAQANKSADSKSRFVQQFNATLRYVLIDANDEAVIAGSKHIALTRFFKNRDDLERAQVGDRAFAHTMKTPKWGMQDVLQSALVVIATGVTVFLIYNLRSQ